MCDTMVALTGATQPGAGTLFAKNSDREFDEAQVLVHLPRARHAPGSTVRLTHVEIPQVPETAEVWLSVPHWMWGAEMGANEHGVVIGNEAVHGRIPGTLEPGVLGMDLLRLTLERSRSAGEAMQVLADLIERHGQGGDCSRTRPRTYNNSFIVADAGEAWVLESLGRFWAAERVRTVRSISNVLSIGADAERVAPALLDDARAQGLLDADGRLDFARAYAPEKTRRSGQVRFARSCGLMEGVAGRADVPAMFAALRDHGAAATAEDRLPQGAEELGLTICMHPDPANPTRGHSANSWVSQLLPGASGQTRTVHWVTAAPSPCLGVFKPLFPDCGLPAQGPLADERADPASRWWWQELVLRPALEGDPGRWRAYRAERDALEQRHLAQVQASLAGDPASTLEARRALMLACWAEADAFQRGWVG